VTHSVTRTHARAHARTHAHTHTHTRARARARSLTHPPAHAYILPPTRSYRVGVGRVGQGPPIYIALTFYIYNSIQYMYNSLHK